MKTASTTEIIVQHDKEFIRIFFCNVNTEEDRVGTPLRLYKGSKQNFPFMLPPEPNSVIQAIKRVSFQIQI